MSECVLGVVQKEMLQGLEVGASLRGPQRLREHRCIVLLSSTQALPFRSSDWEPVMLITDVDASMWLSGGQIQSLGARIGVRKGRWPV